MCFYQGKKSLKVLHDDFGFGLFNGCVIIQKWKCRKEESELTQGQELDSTIFYRKGRGVWSRRSSWLMCGQRKNHCQDLRAHGWVTENRRTYLDLRMPSIPRMNDHHQVALCATTSSKLCFVSLLMNVLSNSHIGISTL